MIEVVVFVVVAVVLLATLVWLAREPRPSAPPGVGPAEARPGLPASEEFTALHCRHYPQVRLALSRRDAEFIARRAPAGLRRRWRKERREVAAQFLRGLRQDHERLSRLARVVAALSPQVSQKREAELFWLGLRFRLLFRLVQVRLRLGVAPLAGLERLVGLLGSMAEEIEARMAAIEAASLARLRPQERGLGS